MRIIPKAGTDTAFELDLAEKLASLSDGVTDVVTSVTDIDNNHVQVIDRLDKITELLERIATALETPVSDAEIRKVSPALADLLKEGRVS